MLGGGAVLDPTAFAFVTPFAADTSSVPSAAFDGGLDRAYFVSTDQPTGATSQVTSIEGFQLSTRNPLWIARFPFQNPATQLTRWGTNGLAFSEVTSGMGTLVLISGPLVSN